MFANFKGRRSKKIIFFTPVLIWQETGKVSSWDRAEMWKRGPR